MRVKSFIILIVNFFTIYFNAMTTMASDNRIMIYEVIALNNQKEFQLKTMDIIKISLKDKISRMRDKYNMQYVNILKKYGYDTSYINVDFNAIWQQAASRIAERIMYLSMLVCPSIMDILVWEEYKSMILVLTQQRF